MQTLAVFVAQRRLAPRLVVPGGEGGAGLHRRADVGQTGLVAPRVQDRADAVFLAEGVGRADKRALQPVLPRQPRGVLPDLLPQGFNEARIGEQADTPRFGIPQRVTLVDGYLTVPKIGRVRVRQSQALEGTTKSATFKRGACGQWFVSLVAEVEMPDVAVHAPDPHRRRRPRPHGRRGDERGRTRHRPTLLSAWAAHAAPGATLPVAQTEGQQ
ncbi:MAG: hypothetical protein M3Y74_13375 [Chloroflexota bacterium]|nr:hypothetical protein [Chloroflexota bacterium]